MSHFKRKRSRKQTGGCPCCHFLKDNSSTRFKPKDREVVERPLRTRNRRPRPFALEYRWDRFSRDWSVWNRYRTPRERDEALRTLRRKNGSWVDYRIPQ